MTRKEARAWGREHRRCAVERAALALLQDRWSPVLCDERAGLRIVAERMAGIPLGEEPGARGEEMWAHYDAMEAEARALAAKFRPRPSPVAALAGWVG